MEIFSILSVVISQLENILNVVVNVIKEIASAFGLIEKNEDPEEFGDKVLQAHDEGLDIDDFDDFNEYSKKLNEFKVDPEKSSEYSSEEKLAATLIYLSKGLEDKFGSLVDNISFLSLIGNNKDYFNSDKVTAYGEEFKSRDLELGKVSDFLSGTLSRGEHDKVGDAIVNSEKRLNPEKSESNIMNDIFRLEK